MKCGVEEPTFGSSLAQTSAVQKRDNPTRSIPLRQISTPTVQRVAPAIGKTNSKLSHE